MVAVRLGRLAADERATVEELCAVLKQDQALAGAVLRLANSPAHWRGAEVVALHAAVVNLGRRALTGLAWAEALHAHALVGGPLVALRRRAWRESLVAAQVAQWVAELRGDPLEDAFVAGLLHDLGRLPVIGALEALLAALPAADTRSEDGWWALVEQHHVAQGARLASEWGLPGVITDVIAQHHDPAFDTPLLTAVRVADEVVRLLDGEPGVGAERLGAIAELSAAQCDALAARLPQLPAYLDAFREPALDEPGLEVIDYELRLPDALDAVPQVTLHLDGLVVDADVLAIDERSVVVRRELKPGRLVRLRAGGVTLHARVTAQVDDGAQLTPWALDGAQREGWEAFVRAVRGGARE
jgi:HD-like signal output (HDOD) protein